MIRLVGLTGLILCGFMTGAQPAAADAVTDWNEITLTAVAAGRPGPIGSVDTALVQLAVHDAVQALDKRFEPYHVEVKGAKGSKSAAAASAAYHVLIGIYPEQTATLEPIYQTYLANKGLTGNPGLEVGQQVAAGILPLRRANPIPLPPPFVGGIAPGQWRPTESFQPGAPATLSPMFAPWMAGFDPFTLTSPARFRADPPPALTSERYRRDYEEVKAYGAFANSARSAEQTDTAHFFNDNIFAQWNRALRAISTQHVDRIGDSARLFALANTAVADSVISAWDSKKYYNFWRPVTAIREGDNDGNPATQGDANWQPLINTPNYPDYTSGVNVVTAAVTRTLEHFFGTDCMTYVVTSNFPLVVNKTRTYERFSDARRDAVNARVWLGIHFRFADNAGRTQGERVADWAYNHYLLPIEKH
jgi:hypothetical protein